MRHSSRMFHQLNRVARKPRALSGLKNRRLELVRLEDRAVPATISGNVYRDYNFNGALNTGEPGLSGQTVFLDANNNGVQDTVFTGPISYPGIGAYPIPIPDNPGGPIIDPVTVSGSNVTGKIVDIDVEVMWTHTWLGDLVITLESPSGQKVKLYSYGTDPNGPDTQRVITFDDEAAVVVPTTADPNGSYQPVEPLSLFDNTFADGVWNLYAQDTFTADSGTLDGWTLKIKTGLGDVATVTNASGDYSFAGLADGTYNVRHNSPVGEFVTEPLAGPPGGGTHVANIVGQVNVTGKNFGRLESNAIYGNVNHDRDGDGTIDVGDEGLAGRTVFLDANNNGVFDSVLTGPTSYPGTGVYPLAIPDSPGGPLVDPLVVSGSNVTGVIFDIDVEVMWTHTWVGDLVITLEGPGGQKAKLYADATDPNGPDTQRIITFDDEAAVVVPPTADPNGSYKPVQSLGIFDGTFADGVWNLYAQDTFAPDAGTLDGWTLKITTSLGETKVTSAADGTFVFKSQTPGPFKVGEVPAAGWNRTLPVGTIAGNLVAGSASANNNFGEAQQNAIYGNTYLDNDLSDTRNAGDTGIANVQVYIDANDNNVFDINPVVNSGPGTVGVVPSANPAGIDFTVNTAGYVGSLYDINVLFDATMTYDADIIASLIAPNGTKIFLWQNVGGAGDNFTGTILDDEATYFINDTVNAVPPFTGSFKPAPGQLSTFDGLSGTDLNGTWTLHLEDIFGGDTMTVNSWSLDIQTAERVTTSDANGNYIFGNVPVGAQNIRRVVPSGYIPNADPAGGKHVVTMVAGSTFQNRDFGQKLDPTPIVTTASAPNVLTYGAATHTVTVVYYDPASYGGPPPLIDKGSIGIDDIKVKAPDSSFLIPISATPTPNADNQTISVDYVIPAFGVDGKWDVTDAGVYEIQVQAGKVFDKDSVPNSVAAGTVGKFRVFAFEVQNLNDSGPGSLRAAIDDSNLEPSLNTITFKAGLSGNILLASSLSTVTDSANIDGPGASVISIDGASLYQILRIDGAGTLNVSIEGLTFKNGNATGTALPSDFGGAINTSDENVTLTNLVFTGNVAAANSGAVHWGPGAGNLTVTDSVFDNNISNGTNQTGGAIGSQSSGKMIVNRSTFSNNKQTGGGGGGALGFLADPVSIVVSNSTFFGNEAQLGAGAFGNGGAILIGNGGTTVEITLNNVTVSGNTAVNGGGIDTLFGAAGTKVTINNSTFNLNTASVSGGNININSSGTADLTIFSSIVANGTAPTGPDLFNTAPATVTFSLIEDQTGSVITADPSNIAPGIDPQLGPLQFNGGTTKTHRALNSAAPIIDQGKDQTPTLGTDQRGTGNMRVFDRAATPNNPSGGDGTDIGAVEFQPPVINNYIWQNGEEQRSRVTNVVLQFSQAVTFPGGGSAAFTMSRYGTGSDTPFGNVNIVVTPVDPANPIEFIVTFVAGGAVGVDPGGSLMDGQYLFMANAPGPNAPLGDEPQAAPAASKVHRLFGDTTFDPPNPGPGADGAVQSNDFSNFRRVFGLAASSGVLAFALDFDADGVVDSDDFAALRRRFGLGGYLP